MFGLFRRSRRLPAPPSFRRPLTLESLQERTVPAAATLTNVQSQLIGSTLIVTGQIDDDSDGADQVSISVTSSQNVGGFPMMSTSIANLTVTDGKFEYITTCGTSPSVTIQVTDDEYLNSTPYQITPSTGTDQAPYLTFQLIYNADQTVTFSGIVYDENAASATVTLTGLSSPTSITPNSSGEFSITVPASGLETVSAVATDAANQQSNTRQRQVQYLPPSIQVDCVPSGHKTFTITGTVSGTWTAGMVVVISSTDVPSLDGVVIPVNEDGTYTYSFTLTNPMDGGFFQASVYDPWNDSTVLDEAVVN